MDATQGQQYFLQGGAEVNSAQVGLILLTCIYVRAKSTIKEFELKMPRWVKYW